MKNFGRACVAEILALVARGVVARYKPTIVMVTGSVGKTSTKDAIAAALSARFYLRKSEKSFNSEFGMPFTILGVANPWHDVSAWFKVAKQALALLLLPNHYPKLLVLEVGADKPGDLAKILRIATPHAVVITRLPEIPVHVEAYASPEEVREEEFSPAYYLPAAAPLIFSAEDEYVKRMALRVPARTLSYGADLQATVCISDVGFAIEEGRVVGMRAQICVGTEREEVVVRGAVGEQQVLPIAAALATATAFQVGVAEALEALALYEPPPSRGRLLAGVRGAVLIDDTYNSSPVAVEEALKTLKLFPGVARRIAVLGDMLELGRYSVAEHERIGVLAAAAADVVVTVGIRARKIAEAAVAAGLPPASVMSYDDSVAAASSLDSLVQTGDVVLVKGSQSIRMERVVEALLADPADFVLLARQESKWKQKT